MSQEQKRETEGLPPMPAADASPEDRARAFELRQAARYGAPTLDDLRRAYAGWGQQWPGDDEVRRRHVVAERPVA
ncbi:hypothetical protein [Actinomycetospora soli]|uniref:hypothetical protein n=1 Tax=Actinomycetospora soli TaxID=2893887 RepID=UPI001E2B8ACA|nr:hypothetical protein [Actinomycetospora soli]MCD2191642.1 hypothetical protein [Actinomycetospora soli]